MAAKGRSPLEALMSAGSPDDVKRFFGIVYRHRADLSTVDLEGVSTSFSVDADAAWKLCEAGRDVALAALYDSGAISGPADVLKHVPDTLDDRLRGLVAKVLAELVRAWRPASVDSRVSLPKLVDFDWRVDVKTASDAVSRMAVPTVLLDLKVQEQPREVGVMPSVRTVNMEMSQEALGTMLAGLQRIRDTLATIK